VTELATDEYTVAILAPHGRDAELTRKVLADAQIECRICADLSTLCKAVRAGVGAILIAEEAILRDAAFQTLVEALSQQPRWSDLPVLILTARGADSPTATRALDTLGNVTLLERPLRVGSFVSSARAAVRARQRQYQIRAHIAEREKTEESLRDADRRKDEFLATLAHELRNPLAPISNAAHLLQLKPKLDSLQWASNVIERQVRQLARLVEDLLDVSRISRDKVELRTSRVDLRDIVQSAIETSQPLITERAHDFRVDLPPDPLPLLADPTRLAQVLSNLLNNAAKFTPRGGRVVLTAAREGGGVSIRVADTGIGIEADMLPQIFDMFIQADNRLERTTGGLGIGLTLVRHFVEMHGGNVRASSPGPNEGSEFVVWLPLALPLEAAAPSHGGDAPHLVPGHGLRILVVDDNRDNADSMCALLQFLGNEVATVNEGTLALESIARAPPDVALLDIGMPNMNGYDVATQIRRQPYGKDMLLIAMTGWGQEVDRQRSQASGFDHHLVKPVDIDQLQRLLGERAAVDTPRLRNLH